MTKKDEFDKKLMALLAEFDYSLVAVPQFLPAGEGRGFTITANIGVVEGEDKGIKV